MTATSLLQSAAPMPLFASRPFLAALGVALFARFTDLVAAPGWFVHDVTLWSLGVLALLDVAARKDQDLRALVEEVDGWVKAGTAAVVHLAVLDPETAAVLQTFAAAGPGLAAGGSLLAAAGVWLLASLRRGTLRVLEEVDEDDDVGVQGLISWFEDLGVAGGVVVAVLVPVLALVLAGLAVLALLLVRLLVHGLEERAKVACSSCGAALHPSAVACPECAAPNPGVRAVGVFGRPTRRPAPPLAVHRLELIARRRCPRCATRLPRRELRQECPACGRETLAGRQELDAYLGLLRDRLPRVLLVCFACALVPFAGLVAGVIYYRVSLVASLRGYVPRSAGCLTRWSVRLTNLLLLALQPVPLLGGLTLPLMCFTNWRLWRRRVLERAAGADVPATPELPR